MYYMLDCNLEAVLDLHDVNLWHALWCKFHIIIVFWFSFADCKNVVASAICLDIAKETTQQLNLCHRICYIAPFKVCSLTL